MLKTSLGGECLFYTINHYILDRVGTIKNM